VYKQNKQKRPTKYDKMKKLNNKTTNKDRNIKINFKTKKNKSKKTKK
jgi:hypothetical protein